MSKLKSLAIATILAVGTVASSADSHAHGWRAGGGGWHGGGGGGGWHGGGWGGRGYYGGGYGYRGGGWGWGIGAGLLGLGIGAAIANSYPRYYSAPPTESCDAYGNCFRCWDNGYCQRIN